MRRLASVRTAVLAGSALASALACTQLIGVADIPNVGPDAGVDASGHHDSGADHVIHGDGGTCETGSSGCSASCAPGEMRCAPNGVAMQTCTQQHEWGSPSVCPVTTPVCVGVSCACVPGSGQCAGDQHQQWQKCTDNDAAPAWVNAGDACAGTCTLNGCGATPSSCERSDGGLEGGLQCTFSKDAGSGSANCCASNEVPGGTFSRSYDGYSTGYTSSVFSATVSAFRLDRFEVTVGRFRAFVKALSGSPDAGIPGWRPPQGSGKHSHLNAGRGLTNGAPGGPFETGWDSSWDSQLNPAALVNEISSNGSSTWNEGPSFALNFVPWAAAYAFCIWDGGFLPSEAEWNFAAAGGDEQRVYPWSTPINTDGGYPPIIDCNHANYLPPASKPQCNRGVVAVGSERSSPGKWGQTDLAGNVLEWTLDIYSPEYDNVIICTDCANLTPAEGAGTDGGPPVLRVQRGGAWISTATGVLGSARGFNPELSGSDVTGFRCARAP